jgi:hypothetical protein
MSTKFLKLGATAFALAAILGTTPCMAREKAEKSELQEIAEEAYIYGFPMVMNYGTLYEYFIDKSSPAYKVRDHVRRQDAAPHREPDQPLPHQLAHAPRT